MYTDISTITACPSAITITQTIIPTTTTTTTAAAAASAAAAVSTSCAACTSCMLWQIVATVGAIISVAVPGLCGWWLIRREKQKAADEAARRISITLPSLPRGRSRSRSRWGF